jgi:hypothetical protein
MLKLRIETTADHRGIRIYPQLLHRSIPPLAHGGSTVSVSPRPTTEIIPQPIS